MQHLLKKYWNNFQAKNYFIFVGIALLMWLIIQLSTEYEFQFQTKIYITDFPKDVIVKNEHFEVNAAYKTSGISHLLNSSKYKTFKIPSNLLIDTLSAYHLDEALLDSLYRDRVDSPVIPKLLEAPAPIKYQQFYSEFLPITPRIEVYYAPSFDSFQPIQLEKDSVQVIGSKDSFEKITEIFTEKLTFDEVSKSFTGKATLESSKEYGHMLLFDEVNFSVEVKQFSEVTFTSKVQISNLPSSKKVQLFPEHVQLRCKVPIEIAKEITSKDFELSVDYNHIQRGFSFLPIEVTKQPKEVKDCWMNTSKVEYLETENL